MEELNLMDFGFVRDLAHRLTGSTFGNDKKYLFESRLISMAKQFKFESVTQLIRELRAKSNNLPKDMEDYFVDVVTTHETLFFRDTRPFRVLKEVIIPELLEKVPEHLDLNFYSAACSTGQEAISMVVTLLESLPLARREKFKVVGTDISKMAVDYAKAGTYTQLEIQRGFPIKLLNKYFDQDNDVWKFKPEYMKYLSYRQDNLLKPEYSFMKYDTIMCRNITIYLEEDETREIYQSLHDMLKPHGFFLVGNSERMTPYRDLFDFQSSPVGNVYKPV